MFNLYLIGGNEMEITKTFHINDMPLPASKKVTIRDMKTHVTVEIHQQKRRMKYYGLSHLENHEPEV